MFPDIAIVLLLPLFNGGLALSRPAMVLSRPARLTAMARQGSRGWAIALDPGRFLSSVQIGNRLVGILSPTLARLLAVVWVPDRLGRGAGGAGPVGQG